MESAGSFDSDWTRVETEKYFNLAQWEPDKTYDSRTVLCVDSIQQSTLYYSWIDQQRPLIINNLSEMIGHWQLCYPLNAADHCFVAENPNWFWYNESKWYYHWKLQDYLPKRTAQYLALMPMRVKKPHRDLTLKKLEPLLPDMIWSYVFQGRQLPNDADITIWENQRFFNPDWYDQTCLTVIVESEIQAAKIIKSSKQWQPFVTEKTFKPLAFQHPFVLIGQPGTLKYLRQQGFETFGNLWNESYDQIDHFPARLNAVVDILKSLSKFLPDKETQRKLMHNYHHFFDQRLISERLKKELFEPMLNYVETH